MIPTGKRILTANKRPEAGNDTIKKLNKTKITCRKTSTRGTVKTKQHVCRKAITGKVPLEIKNVMSELAFVKKKKKPKEKPGSTFWRGLEKLVLIQEMCVIV